MMWMQLGILWVSASNSYDYIQLQGKVYLEVPRKYLVEGCVSLMLPRDLLSSQKSFWLLYCERTVKEQACIWQNSL